MALPSSREARLDAVKAAAEPLEWPSLLPQPTDSEEERQAKRRQLVKALHVKSGALDASRIQFHEVANRPLAGKAAGSKQRAASRERPAQQQPAEGGWKQAVRGRQAERPNGTRLPARPSPTLPAPAATQAPAAAQEPVGAEGVADADDTAAAEYHTPLLGRMLPAPGRAAAKAAQHGSGCGAGATGTTAPLSGLSSGVSSVPTSSSGIPTVPTTGAAAAGARSALEEQIAARRRRRQAIGEPALGSGRLPLSAGGFLSGPIRAPGAALPGPSQQTQQAGEGQLRQRRWRQQQAAAAANPLAQMMQRHVATAAQQQQHASQPPLSQLLLDGGGFQPGRPSRFAPETVPVAAPISLTTQIGPSQLLESLGGGQQQDRSAEAQQQQRQQQQQQREQREHQQQREQQQQHKRQRQEGEGPSKAQACPEEGQQAQHPAGGAQAGLLAEPQPPAQQQGARQHTPASLPRQWGRAAATGTAGLGTLLGTGTFGLLPSDWTLPPTPSCMHAFSPDSPASAAAAAGGAAAGQPASSAKPGAAAAAAAAADAVTALRRTGTLTEETPMLFASPASAPQRRGAEQQDSEEAGGRQLFVAETPSDPSAAAGASDGADAGPQRASQLGPAPLPLGALEAAAAPPPTAARPAASVCGLQLQLPQPVLQVSPCADGRHLALLLGNFAPAGEPSDVLVLQLPSELSEAAGDAPAAAEHDRGFCGLGGSCCGVRVVACVAVQRSKFGEGLELTPNCLQLAATERAGLQLVLSAALELADEPPAAQPSILVLPLSSLSRGSSPALPDDEQQQRQQQAVSPPGQLLPPRPRRLRQGQQPLAIECRDVPLTCVLVAGSQELLVAGDGSGEVRLLSFDPLWRSYTWGRSLPPAKYRTLDFEDLQQLQLYRDPECGASAASADAPPRRLLLGLSGSGQVALWDLDRSELLAARPCLDWRIRCLQPLSMAQAGLTTPVKQRVSAGAAAGRAGAAAGGAAGTSSTTHLFVGLVEHRQSRRQQVAAVTLGPTGLMVSTSGALELPRPQPGRRPQAQHAQQQQNQVTALAVADGGCCWLGTAAGELLPWELAGHGGTGGMAAAVPGGRVHGCSSRSAVTCAAPLPSGEWQLVAATAGGCCTLLARR